MSVHPELDRVNREFGRLEVMTARMMSDGYLTTDSLKPGDIVDLSISPILRPNRELAIHGRGVGVRVEENGDLVVFFDSFEELPPGQVIQIGAFLSEETSGSNDFIPGIIARNSRVGYRLIGVEEGVAEEFHGMFSSCDINKVPIIKIDY